MRYLAVFVVASLGIASAAAASNEVRQAMNTTRPFQIHMQVTHGSTKYDNWVLGTWHRSAASADLVFEDPSKYDGAAFFLNGTELQLQTNYGYALSAFEGNWDQGGTRWWETEINAYATGRTSGIYDSGSGGIVIGAAFFDGWIVCEWTHGFNEPQLFHMLKEEDSGFTREGTHYGPNDIPETCARVLLIPTYM